MTSICGKCGGKISADVNDCPACNPSRPQTEAVPVLMIIALLCSSFLLVGSSLVNMNAVPQAKREQTGDLNLAAYNTARQHIAQTQPSVQNFSEYAQSGVEHSGRVFKVTIYTDELDETKAPVRSIYEVEMEYANDKWMIKSLKH